MKKKERETMRIMNQKGKPRRDSGNDSLICVFKTRKALMERKEKGEGEAGLGKEGMDWSDSELRSNNATVNVLVPLYENLCFTILMQQSLLC